MFPVAILAGGLATRLRPLTDGIPKSLAPVNGEPFAFHQLRQLRAEGVEDVVFCVGYRGEMIKEAVGDGARFGLRVQYVFDGPALKGTGGALRQALPLLGAAFFVLYGDSYLDIRYREVEATFRASRMPALMTVLHNEGRWDTSNVIFRNGRIVTYDKRNKTPEMVHVDYGLGVVTSGLLEARHPDDVFDLAEIYTKLAAEGRLAGYETNRRFYEIGTLTSLRETEAFISGGSSMTISEYTKTYWAEVQKVASGIDQKQVDAMVGIIKKVREDKGRLFFIGVGGSAGNCGHAVNDFRKIANVESYAPTDNVSELTARTNDDGWASVFSNWLLVSHINEKDCVFVFSVGGGNLDKNISPNIVEALKLAKSVKAKVIGVVGRDGGYTKQVADACVVVPTISAGTVTPHTEAFHAVVWHGIVTHPDLQQNAMKWESTR